MRFIDQTTIHVKAGDGGHGCIAFLREKFRPHGGPCGGDGGNGGDVVFKSSNQLSTLEDLPKNYNYKAKNGQHGLGKNCHGKNGENLIIMIPVGTIIKNNKTGYVIHDFKKHDEEYIIASGGNGGFGNARFKTKSNVAPKVANDGEKGQEIKLDLELKVLADVGLVGFPNAGKSTFISKISNSKPKISDYPFTTLTPNLGIVKYEEYSSFVVADIPGLIKGAAKGKGLGNQFLRHIERTQALAFVIDSNSEDIGKDYKTLIEEISSHDSNLKKKPKIILLSKIDINTDQINKSNLPKDTKIIEFSSFTRKNLDKAIQSIAYLVNKKNN